MGSPLPEAVVPLHASQAEAAGELLAKAFQSDPAFVLAFSDPIRRRRALCWLFARLVRCACTCGRVLTTTTLAGVALWLGPDRQALPPWQLLRAGFGAFPFVCGWSAFLRFIRLAQHSQRLHSRAVHGRHWYLFALAVDPGRQRQGIGKALLRHLLTEADASGLPCYLDTTNQANLAYYAELGFALVGEQKVPVAQSELTIWAMVRSPHADTTQ